MRTNFVIRFSVRSKTPDEAWVRARAAVSLLQTQDPPGVTVGSLEFAGAGHSDGVRVAMQRAAKTAPPVGSSLEERAEYRRLHRAAALLDRRREHLESREPRSEAVAEHERAEAWALAVAIHHLDVSLRAREPVVERMRGLSRKQLADGESDHGERP